MADKQNIDYFLISIKSNNLMENRDIKFLILGKKYENKYKIYELRVNSMVNSRFYYNLMVGGDFSESDFKEIDYVNLQDKIISQKSNITDYIFSNSTELLLQNIKK